MIDNPSELNGITNDVGPGVPAFDDDMVVPILRGSAGAMGSNHYSAAEGYQGFLEGDRRKKNKEERAKRFNIKMEGLSLKEVYENPLSFYVVLDSMIFDGLPVAVNSSIHGVLNCESRTLRQMIAVYSAMERRYGNQLSIRYPDEANSGYDLAQKTLKEFPDSNRLISKLGLTDKPERKAPEVRSLYILDPVAQSVYDATCKMIDGLIEDGGLDSTASEFIIKTGMKCLGDFLIGQYQSTLSARQIDKLDSTIVTRGEFIAFFEPKQTEANAQA